MYVYDDLILRLIFMGFIVNKFVGTDVYFMIVKVLVWWFNSGLRDDT